TIAPHAPRQPLTTSHQEPCNRLLYCGIAMLIPANLEFVMANTGDTDLTMYLVNEPIPEGFRPNEEILVVDENTTPITSS
ncbi:MAG: hypothetical protein O2782_09080, partial [bacterium]|nr:hypothetical protein [bacterium]